MSRIVNAAFVAVLVAILGATWLSQQPAADGDRVVDSWPIGSAQDCSADVSGCDGLVRAGLAGLDSRNPGHAEVTSWALHAEGAFSNALTDEKLLITRSGISGGSSVLVVKLADGSTRAIGVRQDWQDGPVAVAFEQRP